jgi:hypothetical protein
MLFRLSKSTKQRFKILHPCVSSLPFPSVTHQTYLPVPNIQHTVKKGYHFSRPHTLIKLSLAGNILIIPGQGEFGWG